MAIDSVKGHQRHAQRTRPEDFGQGEAREDRLGKTGRNGARQRDARRLQPEQAGGGNAHRHRHQGSRRLRTKTM